MTARAATWPGAWTAPLACVTAAAVLALVLHAPLPPRGAAVMPVAVLFDFTFTIPLLWWLLAVRGRGASQRSLVLVFVASMAAARLLVGDRTPVTTLWLQAAAATVEVLLLVRIGLALRAARRADGADLPERAERGAASLFGEGLAARAAAAEFSLMSYALAGPWLRPVDGPGRFSHQREAGRLPLVVGIVMMLVFEMGALHAALVQAHPRIAWALTLSSLWGVLWIVGDHQALRLRRSTLADGMLHLRVGMLARADVPLADNTVARAGRLGEVPRSRDTLVAFPKPARATVLLELATPTQARGLYGWPRRVRHIALAPDDRARFLAELAAEGVAVESV